MSSSRSRSRIHRIPPKQASWRLKNKRWAYENDEQERKTLHNETCSCAEGPNNKLIPAAKKGVKSMVGETISEQGAVFVRTIDARLRQKSSRHEEILQNLDRTDKLKSGKKGSLEAKTQKTMESTEQA